MTAFRATYADWKLIKTRACVQVVFEIPVEQSDAAYQLLGGMPVAAREVWCGIARLEQPVSPQRMGKSDEATPRPAQPPASAGDDKPRRSFSSMSPAQQAGMLCIDVGFRRFIDEKICTPCTTVEQAADIVREFCDVKSRSELTVANSEWARLLDLYRTWQIEAEVVPA